VLFNDSSARAEVKLLIARMSNNVDGRGNKMVMIWRCGLVLGLVLDVDFVMSDGFAFLFVRDPIND
jgi:hypothetical protein